MILVYGMMGLWKFWTTRLCFFSSRGLFSQDRSRPLLSYLNVHKDIQDLYDKYVTALTDKAANNFVVVCKKIYIVVL